MTIYNELNRISIKKYLASKGIYPTKEHGYYGMYRSPFREETNASMKVDYAKNLWHDFGTNDGGTMIDLVMRINNCSLKEAIDELNRYNSTSVNQYNNTTAPKSESFSFHGSGIIVQKAQPITNPALINYLREREINLDIARQHCKEIHYTANNKPFFAIGFPNNSKGWILRSEPFKGCTSMDITTRLNTEGDKDSCLVFEGFMDYLSFLTLKGTQSANQNVVVLNSVANLSKVMNFIQSHKNIYTYLDNDEAGKKTTQQIKTACPNSVVSDQSVHYAKYKDLNEYLISTKKVKQEKPKVEVKRKPSGGFKR